MIIIPTTYSQDTLYYQNCLKNYYEQGIEYLRINCTRVSVEDYIIQMKNLYDNSMKINHKEFKILLDLPIPKTKPRIKFQWPVPEGRSAKNVGGETNYFRIDKGEFIYIVNEFNEIYGELQFEINNFSYLTSMNINDIVYISENSLKLKLIEKNNNCVKLQAISEGFISYNKSIYTEQINSVENKDYLIFKPLIEYVKPKIIALSFIESGDEIKRFKKLYDISDIKIMAKVETQKAINNIHSIINEADMILVGRGDLYVNSTYSEFPINIDRIFEANENKIPIFIATEILASLKSNSLRPSRAELTEIFYYIQKNIAGFILNFGTSQDINVFNTACNIIEEMHDKINIYMGGNNEQMEY